MARARTPAIAFHRVLTNFDGLFTSAFCGFFNARELALTSGGGPLISRTTCALAVPWLIFGCGRFGTGAIHSNIGYANIGGMPRSAEKYP